MRDAKLLHIATDPIHARDCVCERLLGQDREKLLASVSIEPVALAEAGVKRVRHPPQYVVAGLVAEAESMPNA